MRRTGTSTYPLQRVVENMVAKQPKKVRKTFSQIEIQFLAIMKNLTISKVVRIKAGNKSERVSRFHFIFGHFMEDHLQARGG